MSRLNVIIDKVTGEVLASEQGGIWVIPSCWDVRQVDDYELVSDENGNVFLKIGAMYPGENPS